MEQKALRNFCEYHNFDIKDITVQQVKDSPGGIEEWSKDDVLQIVVDNASEKRDSKKSPLLAGQSLNPEFNGAINQSVHQGFQNESMVEESLLNSNHLAPASKNIY